MPRKSIFAQKTGFPAAEMAAAGYFEVSTTLDRASSNHLSTAVSILASRLDFPGGDGGIERLPVRRDEIVPVESLIGLVAQIIGDNANQHAHRGSHHLPAHGLDEGSGDSPLLGEREPRPERR